MKKINSIILTVTLLLNMSLCGLAAAPKGAVSVSNAGAVLYGIGEDIAVGADFTEVDMPEVVVPGQFLKNTFDSVPDGAIAVANQSDLLAIGESAATKSKSYYLTASINMTSEWTEAINTFTGIFDGRGYTINFNHDTAVPVFGNDCNGAEFRNLGVNYTSANGLNTILDAGGIAISGAVTITNCFTTGKIQSTVSAGGLVGQGSASSESTVTKSYIDGKVSVPTVAGSSFKSDHCRQCDDGR